MTKMDEAVYPRAKPAEQCPSCGGWFVMGHCHHYSSTSSGTLYGVCKGCADAHTAFGKWLDTGEIDRAMIAAAQEG